MTRTVKQRAALACASSVVLSVAACIDLDALTSSTLPIGATASADASLDGASPASDGHDGSATGNGEAGAPGSPPCDGGDCSTDGATPACTPPGSTCNGAPLQCCGGPSMASCSASVPSVCCKKESASCTKAQDCCDDRRCIDDACGACLLFDRVCNGHPDWCCSGKCDVDLKTCVD